MTSAAAQRHIIGIVMLVAICVGAFALTMAAKSAGRGECGGRCTGCGKCGKKIAGRK